MVKLLKILWVLIVMAILFILAILSFGLISGFLLIPYKDLIEN